uniref:Uncharacterized protein n=1 Tax=Oryza rufipogon TaxID=4529 RepID=A0A0E0QGA6_ORYRU
MVADVSNVMWGIGYNQTWEEKRAVIRLGRFTMVDGQGYKEENIAGYGSSFLLLMKIMMLVIQSDFSVDEVQTHEANNFVDNSWPKMKVMPIANVPVVMFMIINC